ncbi:hypothetical protein [Mesobacillus foraminis]|uniref:YopA central domain-containing protein n=1 Tax=Mesobacillus foraminis TaxID=279826 RepID=A0A4R2B3D5_9BACI|nr:hypothetical protein [Mesobacillus foraminis]TCN21091.1 hypothetical protein EV146_11315 [Mesobacillus foraminis]
MIEKFLSNLKACNSFEEITLYSGNLWFSEDSISSKNKYFVEQGKVSLKLLPTPEVIFESDNYDLMLFEQKGASIVNKIGYLETESFLVGSIDGTRSYTSGIGKLNTIKSREEKEITSLEFFIVNNSGMNSTLINIDDWIIEIEPVRRGSQDSFNDSFDITSIGKIIKKDGSVFKPKETNLLMEALIWLFSFVHGRLISIPILQGFNQKDLIWHCYSSDKVDIYEYHHTWYRSVTPEPKEFNELFVELNYKLKDELWENVLKQVLNWYHTINSNNMPEVKIVSAQVALELLAWTYLVKDREVIEEEGYKKLRTSDALRILFYDLEINKEIITFNNDNRLTKYKSDGIYMFTDFRNNIIHADKKEKYFLDSEELLETVVGHGIEFVESVILKILNFKEDIRFSKEIIELLRQIENMD